MYPELFELPFIGITVKSYGLIMVMGFLAAVALMRKIAVKEGQDPDHITNVALYTLLAGIVGARFFYVIHHYDDFQGQAWWAVFATWRGGLELVGGVILSIFVTVGYLVKQKLSVPKYLDILAIGLMLGLSFGRVGCFFSGCCWGKPTDAAWSIRFPYASDAYLSQINPDPKRNRELPLLVLPKEYFGWVDSEGVNRYPNHLKHLDLLAESQRYDVTKGQYRCLAVHPTQLLSSLCALAICGILYFAWLRFLRRRPGRTFCLMLIIYGVVRFFLEFLRDDNPFESGWWTLYNGWTVSQNIGLYMSIAGLFGWVYLAKMDEQQIELDEIEEVHPKEKSPKRDHLGRFIKKTIIPKSEQLPIIKPASLIDEDLRIGDTKAKDKKRGKAKAKKKDAKKEKSKQTKAKKAKAKAKRKTSKKKTKP